MQYNVQCTIRSYQNNVTTKDLWDALEDTKSKKFLATKVLSYKKLDFKPIVERFTQHNKKLDGSISVTYIDRYKGYLLAKQT